MGLPTKALPSLPSFSRSASLCSLACLAAFLVFLSFLASGCSNVPEIGRADPLSNLDPDPLARLVSGLLRPETEIPGPLALGDLLLGGSPCDLGEEAGKALPAFLERQRPELQVISYANLQALLKEQKLQMEDMFMEPGVGAGRLLPARSLLVGFFFSRPGSEPTLRAQILDLESGEILSSASTSFPGVKVNALTPYDNVPLEVEYLVTARIKGIEEEILLEEGDKLWSGDRVKIRLKPNRPAYLYVFLLDAQGSARLLFPGTPGGPARIEAGELHLPSSPKYYQLDTHPGKESILVAASLNPLSRIEELLHALNEEAARSLDVLETVSHIGRRGFVGISSSDNGGRGLNGILRTYSGTIWGTFEFLHLP